MTHTHAGVDALRQRFRALGVTRTKYHVDTIAGWAWAWVRMYRRNGDYRGSMDVAEWTGVYAAMCNRLHEDVVGYGILNSYAGVIVDEYQDCTASMHALVLELKSLLPCRVLGEIFRASSASAMSWLVGPTFGVHSQMIWEPSIRRTGGSRLETKISVCGFRMHAALSVLVVSLRIGALRLNIGPSTMENSAGSSSVLRMGSRAEDV